MPTHPEVANAIAYAETILDVHGIAARSLEAADALEAVLVKHVEALNLIRHRREQIEEAEVDLQIAERAANPEMSATAFVEHMRVAKQQASGLREMRADLMALQNEADARDAEATALKNVVNATASRQRELSGLLYFYGVAKLASLSPVQQVQGAAT